MDEKVFAQGLFKLNLQWQDHEMPAEVVALYRERLGMVTNQEFVVAVNHCLDTCTWYPKIADLKKAVLTFRNQGRPSAAERWGQLIMAAERGEGGPTDPATVRALQVCGGWEGFNRMDYKDLDFRRRDFERVYTEDLEKQDRQALLGLEDPNQKRLEG